MASPRSAILFGSSPCPVSSTAVTVRTGEVIQLKFETERSEADPSVSWKAPVAPDRFNSLTIRETLGCPGPPTWVLPLRSRIAAGA